jgi:hypothetical protein
MDWLAGGQLFIRVDHAVPSEELEAGLGNFGFVYVEMVCYFFVREAGFEEAEDLLFGRREAWHEVSFGGRGGRGYYVTEKLTQGFLSDTGGRCNALKGAAATRGQTISQKVPLSRI